MKKAGLILLGVAFVSSLLRSESAEELKSREISAWLEGRKFAEMLVALPRKSLKESGDMWIRIWIVYPDSGETKCITIRSDRYPEVVVSFFGRDGKLIKTISRRIFLEKYRDFPDLQSALERERVDRVNNSFPLATNRIWIGIENQSLLDYTRSWLANPRITDGEFEKLVLEMLTPARER